jgi:hypothetical protein
LNAEGVLTKEYYLHALSGARPHDEDQDADVEADQPARKSINRLLTAASLPSKASMENLLSMPAAM